jgi:hypothetical protein
LASIHEISLAARLPSGRNFCIADHSVPERPMRCNFMRKGHIAGVEFLTAGSDEALIEQGRALFGERSGNIYDGFEVWDGDRRLHVYPEGTEDRSSS